MADSIILVVVGGVSLVVERIGTDEVDEELDEELIVKFMTDGGGSCLAAVEAQLTLFRFIS